MSLPNNTCPLCGHDHIWLDDSNDMMHTETYQCEYCQSVWSVSYIVEIKDWEVIEDNTDKVPVVDHDAQIEINKNIG